MKKYNPIYYLLFILLVMGAFASMAQNSYGLKIMGGVAFVFGLLFLIELITVLQEKGKKDIYRLIELICLLLLSFIFACRVFYIYFSFVEWLFAAAGGVLVLIYTGKMISRYRDMKPKNGTMAMLIVLFHLSIILFLVSLVIVPFAQKSSQVIGIIAFVLFLVFIITALIKKDFLVEGQQISSIRMVTYFKDHSIIIVSLFLLFSLYVGFNKAGLIPGIYSDEFPQAYFKLVDEATNRKEKQVDGKYKYEEFKEQYDRFLKNNSMKE
ncbi:MAG TPA: hypothetical protein VF144_15720 [Chitinophagaceae bacterium]